MVPKPEMTISKEDAVNEQKPKRRRYRATDPDFVPPDGGWGWLVIFACGFSNLSNFPMFQQFGLIFREKFQAVGISNAQITTVINLNSAFNSCVGLLNGPLFRAFSYRQVALFGACLVASSLFITRFCNSFWTYLIFYSACYGSGIGITQSANSIALNTYWKKKRRIATGLSWSVTGFGPIVWPYIITALMGEYGMENTLMIFAAFAGHAIVCSLLLQPVHWHTKYRDEEVPEEKHEEPKNPDLEQKKPLMKSKSRSLFSSQYLLNENPDRFTHGYDIVEPVTPMYAGANDGWYSYKNSLAGSRISLASSKGPKISEQNSLAVSVRTSYANLQEAREVKESKREAKKRLKAQSQLAIQESVGEDCPTEKAPHDLKEEEKHLLQVNQNGDEKEVLKSAAKILREYKSQIDHDAQEKKEEMQNHKPDLPRITVEGEEVKQEDQVAKQDEKKPEDDKPKTIFEKIIIFFDLTLLKDPIYLNLMLGLTIANFAELNFSILTPFVLKEFNFEAYQIATFMSVLGALDIAVRLVIPFFAEKIGWENKTFFLIGVLMMAGGRVILVHTQTYGVSIFVAVIIGFGKGLRTIFLALVIPSYVPLERLPAASGLQLATSGLLFLILGPVVGWIRDAVQDYVITLHILNITTYMTTIAWLGEPYVTRYYKKRKQQKLANANQTS